MQVDAIVLAGAKNDGKLQEISSCEFEALIPINEQPMINYVISALRDTAAIRKIVVVGSVAMKKHLPDNVILLECGETLPENIKIGIDYLDSKRHVLIITSDIPMVQGKAIEDFLDRCRDKEEDLFYPIVSKVANQKMFPGVNRTYVQLKDGTFTGGNLVLMAPNVIEDCREMIQRVVELRKKPVQISRMLGISFIVKLLLHKLSVHEIEHRVEQMFGLRALAVISPYPEIGTDIDKASDWELAQRVLTQKAVK